MTLQHIVNDRNLAATASHLSATIALVPAWLKDLNSPSRSPSPAM
jgi:hypothetical protein